MMELLAAALGAFIGTALDPFLLVPCILFGCFARGALFASAAGAVTAFFIHAMVYKMQLDSGLSPIALSAVIGRIAVALGIVWVARGAVAFVRLRRERPRSVMRNLW